MTERKETRQYTLTVEGETEKMYFEWLQKEINTSENARYKVKINASIQQFPLSYIKKLNTKSTPSVVHICDVEGNPIIFCLNLPIIIDIIIIKDR